MYKCYSPAPPPTRRFIMTHQPPSPFRANRQTPLHNTLKLTHDSPARYNRTKNKDNRKEGENDTNQTSKEVKQNAPKSQEIANNHLPNR